MFVKRSPGGTTENSPAIYCRAVYCRAIPSNQKRSTHEENKVSSVSFSRLSGDFCSADYCSLCIRNLGKDTISLSFNPVAHEKSDLLPDPALIFGKLPNSFRYVLMKNHEPKDRVSIRLNIQSGSLHETDDQQGLAHYLEHMMFNGSEHFPSGELVKYFQSIGMDFGGDANAHTGFGETVYDVLLPGGDKEDVEKGLLVIHDYAAGALLPESEIDRERGIILAEKRDRDSVGYRTYVASMKFLFPGIRINKRMPIGTEEVIRKTDQAILKDYYDTWYRPENMILVMVGDVDTEMAESLIKSMFADMIPRNPVRSCPEMGTIKHEGIRTFYHFEKEAGDTTTSVQATWISRAKTRFPRLSERTPHRIYRGHDSE